MKDLVKERIAYILHKHFLIGEQTELASYKKFSVLGLNIMEQMELLWYLENEFEIELEDREVMTLQTIGDAVTCVTRKLQQVHQIAA
jgi:acyl carrier protein